MARFHSNWLEGYYHYTKHSEAPDLFHFWTGVSVVAGALRRQVWIDQRYFQWTPNFYIVLVGPAGVSKVYGIRGGKFFETSEQERYTGEVRMSEDTFLDLVDGAIHGRGEEVFLEKYRRWHIEYFGEQWLVDSERFRKVLKRLGTVPIRSLM